MITKLVDRMIGQEILESENRDEYIYALTIRAEQVITYTLLAMVCLWTHNILEGLIYAVAFKGIRQYSGGYHAKTLLGCLVGTIAMLLAVVRWIAPFLQAHPIVMIFLVIISICVLFIFSPVNHPNFNLSKEEMSDCRKGVYVAILTEVLIASCLYLLSGILHIFIASAIILCALTVILAKLLRQEIM